MNGEFKYTRVREIQEDTPFLVSKLTRAILRHRRDGQELDVTLDRDEFLKAGPLDANNRSQDLWIEKLTAENNPGATYLEEVMKRFVKGSDVALATENEPVRWLGAGGILLVKDRCDIYSIINKREGSFIHPGDYDANGGLSSSIEEMVSPTQLAQRELGEELLIDSVQVKDYKLQRIIPRRNCRINISYKGQHFCEEGLILTVDAKTGSIDFRTIDMIHVSNIVNLTFADAETIHTRNNTPLPTNRPVFAFRLTDILGILRPSLIVRPTLGFREGKRMTDEELLDYKISQQTITPALKSILESLKYDVDFQTLE